MIEFPSLNSSFTKVPTQTSPGVFSMTADREKKTLSENKLLFLFGNAIRCSLLPYFNSMSGIMQYIIHYSTAELCVASQCSNAQHWQSWIHGWSHHQQISCSTDSLGAVTPTYV